MSNDIFELMGLFNTLEEVAKIGNKVVINGHYKKGDDNMAELGEDFESSEFNMILE